MSAASRPRPDLRSLRRQVVLFTALLAALVGVALVGAVHLAVSGASANDAQRVLQGRAHAVADGVRAASGSTLTVPASLLDPGVAVYDDAGDLVAGEIPASLAGTFAELSRTPQTRSAQVGERYRVLALRFTAADGPAAVVVAEPLGPYEQGEHTALLVAGGAAVLATLLATAAAAWASRRVLAPVAEMARTAREWSERDLDRRFALGGASPGTEIEALGRTLDGLLDKVRYAIHAEQRLTAELAHELRTPLTAVLGTAELIAMRTDLDDDLRQDVAEIQTACRSMSTTITSLLELARAPEGGGGSSSLAEAVAIAWAEVEGAGVVSTAIADDLRVAMPQALVVRTLSPVLANAARVARRVEVAAHPTDGQVVIDIRDDGPGVPEGDAELIFSPGHSGRGGSGLGLPLARRIARTVGGDVVSVPTAHGAAFEIRLPAALGPDRSRPRG